MEGHTTRTRARRLLPAQHIFSNLFAFDEISRSRNLSVWQNDNSTVRPIVEGRRFVDSSIRYHPIRSLLFNIYIYIFFFHPRNKFVYLPPFCIFFHGLVWLTTNGSRDFRKKFGDPPSGTLFSLRHSWRKKKKKKNGKKWTSFVPFFSVSIVRISTFVTRVCFSARMYNDSILRKQWENPENGRERTKKKIRKREVNDETRRH